jgi:hypothetical protein
MTLFHAPSINKFFFLTDTASDSMMNSAVMCDATDDDSVGDASTASLAVYEVFDEDDI